MTRAVSDTRAGAPDEIRRLVPDDLPPPFGRYVHGVLIPPNARLVLTSGQLGMAAGEVPAEAEAQARLCLEHIRTILAEADMTPRDIVKLGAFVTDRKHMAAYMRARDAFLADVDPPPASTLVIVSGFTRAEFLVEVEAVAARPC